MTFFTENAYAEVARVCGELGIKGEPGSFIWESNLRNAINTPPLQRPLRTCSTPTYKGGSELKEKFEAEFVNPERYFLIGYVTNAGGAGNLLVTDLGFPSNKSITTSLQRLCGIQEFAITLVYEFKSKQDFEDHQND